MTLYVAVCKLDTKHVLYTVVPLSLHKHQCTVFPAAAGNITAVAVAAPLPCGVIDTLM